MCGITGFFSYKNKINTQKYYDAHLKISHRGPDDEGFIYKNNNNEIEHLIGNDTIKELYNRNFIYNEKPSSLILGHRRLSIIDLTSAGHQPFVFENLYLVYNGEIYNYIELREELKELGYSFETDSDTEVFLKAYHCWGVNAFNKFNGMWASAIYDKKNDTILLTRDRFGIKPLYYSIIDDNLIFGSEIKFVSSFIDRLYSNEQMVYEYLRFNYIDHSKYTLFKNILQLEPNSYMKYSQKNIKILQYWKLKDEFNISKKNIAKKLNSAIKLRMRSDVEVGSLLSGGIDSSVILGIINKEKYSNKFQTFSAVFKEERFSEKKYIDKFTTDNIQLKKHYIYPQAEIFIHIIDELIYVQEEPFRSLAVFSQYEIYKYIKNNTNTTVLLNGQGADEIFTGYTEYYYIYLLELLRTLKFSLFWKEFCFFTKNRNIGKHILLKQLLIHFLSNYMRKPDKYKLFSKKFKINKKKKIYNDLLKNGLWNSLTFSALKEYLRYEDRNSMRFSLESRLPFLDFRLVQSAFSLKNSSKIKDGLSKIVLRDIAKYKIPDSTLNRKDKMGFISPQEVWQKTILKDEFDNVFEDIKINGIFNFIDKERVDTLYQEYQNNKLNDWSLIWRIYLVYKWKNKWEIHNEE
jgi:asparagine synthase (glutamine-hydrolysing)